MLAIAARQGARVVPYLMGLLGKDPPQPELRNQLRIGAANCLGAMGGDAQAAIPALARALATPDEAVRSHVERALARIQAGEAPLELPQVVISK